MKTRYCPECGLKFKGKARRASLSSPPTLACPRCEHEWPE